MEKENALKPDASISTAVTVIIALAVVTLVILCGGLLYWYFAVDVSLGWESVRPLLIVCGIAWIALVCLIVLGFLGVQLWQICYVKTLSTRGGRENHRKQKVKQQGLKAEIARSLRKRYTLFWRHNVRLLLVAGDDAAIEQLIPGLQQQQWLEGNRTVLIYGGSLTSEPDREKYTALRKLRRGRPLDGIVRVMPQSLNLTPQISDNDLRGLEKISELLRYSAPVWLWQLCDSKWSQAKRTEQPVGASFPIRARADDITRQLEMMLPELRAQGVNQILENNNHDFLLRLGQHLKDGGIARWAQQLLPWLSDVQQRVPLRGLMFSLPENKSADTSGGKADAEKYVPESQRHALTLPVTWQGIVDDCTRIRGRRVGMAWEQTLAWMLAAIIGLWGAGLLVSFMLNYGQITSVAGKARNLVEHPSVSDYQLTALHALRNDAGACCTIFRKARPGISASVLTIISNC